MKKKLAKMAVIGVSLFELYACSFLPNIYTPEIKNLRKIEFSLYNIKSNKCTHKSIRYHGFLKSKGIVSRVVLGLAENSINLEIPHAWVEVFKSDKNNPRNGTWHMIDPTWIRDGEGFVVGRVEDGGEYMDYNKYYPERTRIYVCNDFVDTLNGLYNDIVWANFGFISDEDIEKRKKTIIRNRKRYKDNSRYPLFPNNWESIKLSN